MRKGEAFALGAIGGAIGAVVNTALATWLGRAGALAPLVVVALNTVWGLVLGLVCRRQAGSSQRPRAGKGSS